MKLDKIDNELLEILKSKENLHSKKMEQIKIMFANVSSLKDVEIKELLMKSIKQISTKEETLNTKHFEMWHQLASLINRARTGDLLN